MKIQELFGFKLLTHKEESPEVSSNSIFSSKVGEVVIKVDSSLTSKVGERISIDSSLTSKVGEKIK